MLRVSTIAATVIVLATPTMAQDRALGNPNWIPGQSRSTLTLYEEPGLQGGSIMLVEREGNLSGPFRAASLRTRGGAWEVCDRHNFRGQCRVVDGWTLSLNRDVGLREVRSVRPLEPDQTSSD